MHKDMIKGNSKVIMRKIKQQWGHFTDDDIAKIQSHYQEKEYENKIRNRMHKALLRTLRG